MARYCSFRAREYIIAHREGSISVRIVLCERRRHAQDCLVQRSLINLYSRTSRSGMISRRALRRLRRRRQRAGKRVAYARPREMCLQLEKKKFLLPAAIPARLRRAIYACESSIETYVYTYTQRTKLRSRINHHTRSRDIPAFLPSIIQKVSLTGCRVHLPSHALVIVIFIYTVFIILLSVTN